MDCSETNYMKSSSLSALLVATATLFGGSIVLAQEAGSITVPPTLSAPTRPEQAQPAQEAAPAKAADQAATTKQDKKVKKAKKSGKHGKKKSKEAKEVQPTS
jgi:hypothetical protein